MRVYASLISRSRFSAGGGCHFVYLAHERNEVFRRFWGFPPPIISCSLAASSRLMSASAASLLLYSSAVGTRTACGIRLHIAHLRGISVSFSLPISLPVFCSGVYCTAGSRPASVSCISRVAIWACLAFVVGGRRGAVTQPHGCDIAVSAPPPKPSLLATVAHLSIHTNHLYTSAAHLSVSQ